MQPEFVIDLSTVQYVFRVREYVFSTQVLGSKADVDRNAGLAAALVQAEVEMIHALLGS